MKAFFIAIWTELIELWTFRFPRSLRPTVNKCSGWEYGSHDHSSWEWPESYRHLAFVLTCHFLTTRTKKLLEIEGMSSARSTKYSQQYLKLHCALIRCCSSITYCSKWNGATWWHGQCKSGNITMRRNIKFILLTKAGVYNNQEEHYCNRET